MKVRSGKCDSNSCGPLDEFSQDMERVFDSLLGRTVGSVLRPSSQDKFVPSLDVYETDQGFTVSLDLPGINPDEVKIEMHEGKLSISGSRTREETEQAKFHRIERSFGNFHRVLALPSDVDVEKIEASYDQGVLVIELPKIEKQQPTKIQIKTSSNS
ncbi:MAG: Hsp20/alpha crystallin family protein [Planctomycetota bacterium]